MTPKEFLNEVVEPNINEFHRNPSDRRRAYNAISSADALAAHIYEHAPGHRRGATNDTEYRHKLAEESPDLKTLFEVAKALKHVSLRWGSPEVKREEQIGARSVAFSEGPYGKGRHGGPPQVFIDLEQGRIYIEDMLDQSVDFLKKVMRDAGIPL
jgi:hypothetical protein